MSDANHGQREFWNGQAGMRWVEDQQAMDELLAPLSDVALAAAEARAGERVLDIGCGCGTTTLALSTQTGHATGVDISEPMIAHARTRAASRHNGDVDFVVADASQWHGDAPYQLAFSRFGVMFFAAPVEAFANIRSNLAADGRLCFICWRSPEDNPWISVAARAAQPFLPETPQAAGPDPFAFADQAYVTDLLTKAGFQEPRFALCNKTLRLGVDLDAAMTFLTRIGPLARVVAELEAGPREQALAAVRDALSNTVTDDGVALPASTWVVTAEAQ